MAGSGEVAGSLTLTASALGFLAGYGSQTFFRFIDGLLGRVYPNGITRTTESQTSAAWNRP
jgi:hypothetical protein